MFRQSFFPLGRAVARLWVLLCFFPILEAHSQPSFADGKQVGVVETTDLLETSGLVASRQNPGILWGHNDSGSPGDLYAMATNGNHVGVYRVLGFSVGDFEALSLGPGPEPGIEYLFLGDIGDNLTNRESVIIYRMPEPAVYLGQTTELGYFNFVDVSILVLNYPDGSHDSEAMMVDPLTGDLFIATKLNSGTALYRASRADLDAGGSIQLEFVWWVSYSRVSGCDISPDGKQIVLRNGNDAQCWTRRPGRSVADAFLTFPTEVPIIGEPIEPNGETIGFDAYGLGYFTVSEGVSQPIFYFRRNDPWKPKPPALLIGRGESWSYRDTGADEGTAWQAPTFDDSGWSSGPAPLGYGQGEEATVIDFGGNPSLKHITTYFRKSFNVSATTPLRNALMRVCYNDGVAVYINGVEVMRRNLAPAAPFNEIATVSRTTFQNIWESVAVNPALFLPGNNVIAVEVHRQAVTGPDLTFDLQLQLDAIEADTSHFSPDSQRPTVTISSPSTVDVTNEVLTVSGTAKDNVAVTRVLWALNAGPFQDATGLNKWSAAAPLDPGTNIVRVVAYDGRTNISTIASRTYIRRPAGVEGTYRGLIMDTNAPSHEHSGPVTLNLTTSGKFSGSLRLGAVNLPVSGQLNYLGNVALTLAYQKTNQLQVTLVLDPTPGFQSITGAVAMGTNWSTPLLAYRTLPFPASSPTPLAGKYSSGISDDTNAPGPVGAVATTTTVSGNGTTTMKGRLADGTSFSFKGYLAPNGQVPLYLPLYSNRGSLFGWLQFTNDDSKSYSGECHWIKTAIQGAAQFPQGFTNRVQAGGQVIESTSGSSEWRPVLPPATNLTYSSGHGSVRILQGGYVPVLPPRRLCHPARPSTSHRLRRCHHLSSLSPEPLLGPLRQ